MRGGAEGLVCLLQVGGSSSARKPSRWLGKRVSGIRRGCTGGSTKRGRRLRARSASRSSCLCSAASRSSWRRRIASASDCWRRRVSRDNSRAAYSLSSRSGLTKSRMGKSRAESVRLWRMLGRRLRPGDAIVGEDIAESRGVVLFEGPGLWRRGRSSSNDTFRSAGCVFRRSFIGARGISNSDRGAL
jgi:hypothetical protein